MFKRITKWTLIVLLMLAAMVGGSYWLIRPNIHVVVPGKVYRSGQLSGAQFYRVIKKYKIRSIVNLRGANVHANWYQQELAVASRLGVAHYNLPMHAYQLPKVDILKQLVKILRNVPRPVLIHCQGGSDRTGLASAIILILRDDSFAKARGQISWRYLAIYSDSVGKLVMPYYKRYLHQHQYKSNQAHFMQWLKQVQFKESAK